MLTESHDALFVSTSATGCPFEFFLLCRNLFSSPDPDNNLNMTIESAVPWIVPILRVLQQGRDNVIFETQISYAGSRQVTSAKTDLITSRPSGEIESGGHKPIMTGRLANADGHERVVTSSGQLRPGPRLRHPLPVST
jgi:hypothetical protein